MLCKNCEKKEVSIFQGLHPNIYIPICNDKEQVPKPVCLRCWGVHTIVHTSLALPANFFTRFVAAEKYVLPEETIVDGTKGHRHHHSYRQATFLSKCRSLPFVVHQTVQHGRSPALHRTSGEGAILRPLPAAARDDPPMLCPFGPMGSPVSILRVRAGVMLLYFFCCPLFKTK